MMFTVSCVFLEYGNYGDVCHQKNVFFVKKSYSYYFRNIFENLIYIFSILKT